jgi:hypothetical protein
VEAMTDPKGAGDMHILWQNSATCCDAGAHPDGGLLSAVRLFTQAAFPRAPGRNGVACSKVL